MSCTRARVCSNLMPRVLTVVLAAARQLGLILSTGCDDGVASGGRLFQVARVRAVEQRNFHAPAGADERFAATCCAMGGRGPTVALWLKG